MNILFQKTLPIGEFIIFDQRIDGMVDVSQTHSNIVLNYEGKSLSDNEADGIIVNLFDAKTIHPVVRTADCLPVCFIGKKSVAMVHAGWRGLANKILLDDKIKKMQPYYAFIGPSICQDSFEVTSEFYDNFPDSKHFTKIDEKIYFNLQTQAIEQITENYLGITVEDSGVCTYKTEQLNSYRRGMGPTRNWNTFSLK